MLTLIEAAKRYSDDLFRQAVIEIYANSTELLQVLPFEGIPGNAIRYNQEAALPGIGFRGINEGYDESTGVINPIVESLVIAGGDLDVDKFILTTMGEGQRSSQEAMKLKALAHRWTNVFIKGDSEVNLKEFDGLQKRVTGTQLLANGSTSGGDALSLDKLEEAIDLVDSPTHLVMNKTMARRFSAAARSTSVGGYITWDKNEFGKRIMMFNDLPILRMGNNGDIYNTLDFTEANPGGGSAVGTSIYVVSFGQDMCHGLQNGDPDVKDLGELQTKPSLRSRLEWYSGLSLMHPRCVARLYGIKNSAIVA